MNLKEVAELVFNKVFPSAETPIDVVEVERMAYAEFAYHTLMLLYNQKGQDGFYEVPSYLLTEVEKDVVENEIDISDLEPFKVIPSDVWMQNIGGFGCDCKYVKTTVNLSQLTCGSDRADDNERRYFLVGKKIKFPDGTHKKTLTITYANMGEDLNGDIEVSEEVASLIIKRLDEYYTGRVPVSDVTNNSNPNT